MEVKRLTADEWRQLEGHAHLAVFQETLPERRSRLDYALVVERAGVPLGYVTCRELDADTVYFQFGGAFPGCRNTTVAFHAYGLLIGEARKHYQRVTTLIENTNRVMLKFAAKVGFQITGIRVFGGSVLVEHVLEFSQVTHGGV